MSYLCLYNKNFQALGQWNQHRVSKFSLKRKAQELDEFTATCQEWADSKDACFVGLHDDVGKLSYLCLAGIPSTKDHLTDFIGTDLRAIFDQEVKIDYSARTSSGSYSINSASSLFKYLMVDLIDSIAGLYIGFDYEVNVDEVTQGYVDWDDSCVYEAAFVGNVLKEIQRLCRFYNLFVSVEISVNRNTNRYALTFRLKRIINVRPIRLADFQVTMRRDANVINMAIAMAGSRRSVLYLHNDDTVDSTFSASKQLFPVKCKTFEVEVDDSTTEAEAFEKALSDAQSALLKNRYRDRCQIDLRNQPSAYTVSDMDFTFFGDLSGYNPADSSTVKRLPVSEIDYDDNGKKTIVFGYLSEYWFLDED